MTRWRCAKDGPQARRLLALAAIYNRASRTEPAKIGGVTLKIVRDWVVKFNAHGPDGLLDRKAPGQPSRLNDTHRVAIAAAIESGPIPAISQSDNPRVNGPPINKAIHRRVEFPHTPASIQT